MDNKDTNTNVAQLEKKNINKSMKAYLERAREHDEFMKGQNYEFQIGKRHLANMMGEDPETFTQRDIDVININTSTRNILITLFLECNRIFISIRVI